MKIILILKKYGVTRCRQCIINTISCTSFCCVFHERAVCPMQRKKDLSQYCTPSNPNKGPSRNEGLIELFIYLLFAFKTAV